MDVSKMEKWTKDTTSSPDYKLTPSSLVKHPLVPFATPLTSFDILNFANRLTSMFLKAMLLATLPFFEC
jgi:hypothetical protein